MTSGKLRNDISPCETRKPLPAKSIFTETALHYPNLENLNLIDTRVTDEGVKRIQAALSRCRIVHWRSATIQKLQEALPNREIKH